MTWLILIPILLVTLIVSFSCRHDYHRCCRIFGLKSSRQGFRDYLFKQDRGSVLNRWYVDFLSGLSLAEELRHATGKRTAEVRAELLEEARRKFEAAGIVFNEARNVLGKFVTALSDADAEALAASIAGLSDEPRRHPAPIARFLKEERDELKAFPSRAASHPARLAAALQASADLAKKAEKEYSQPTD